MLIKVLIYGYGLVPQLVFALLPQLGMLLMKLLMHLLYLILFGNQKLALRYLCVSWEPSKSNFTIWELYKTELVSCVCKLLRIYLTYSFHANIQCICGLSANLN